MEQLQANLQEYAALALEWARHPAILIQLGVIVGLLLPAWLLARRLRPRLEARARQIRGMKGLLRLIAAVKKRVDWLIYAVLVGIAYLAARASGWPGREYLLYVALLLSTAWFLIYVASNGIRSRFLGKLFAVLAWTWVTASILGVRDEVVAALDAAGFTLGELRISLLSALQGALVLGALLWLSAGAGNFLDRRIQGIDELTPSLRVLLGKILRIGLLVLAVLVAMQSLGINLTALTVLSGAVGVGIGFGLQKVVSNFISGIIILLDRSIKPGDTISLGETFGWIRELRARFVSVVTRDGREYLIPNEDFITQQVINWSFSDRYVRLDVPFGVSYECDPHEVGRLAIAAAAGVERVSSRHRAPVCWLTGFGDSSLDFLLRFWIEDPEKGLTNIRGKVLLALWDTFKEHGIGIPYPHREVIFRNPPAVGFEPEEP